jgi:dipeptidyl aminopeptidase/acylaminoacyl peptidase
MRRTMWVLAGLAVTTAVVGGVIVNFGDLGDRVGGPLLTSNGTIVYEANGNIRMVNPDGSEDGRVIGALNDGVAQTCPRYSPDGLWLSHQESLFGGLVGDPDLEKTGLVRNRLDTDGRPHPAAELLTEIHGSNWELGKCGQWSPDGQAIALFRTPNDADGEIAILSMGDRSVEFLPGSLASDSIYWSPAGDLLAFATRDGIAIADIAAGEFSVVPTLVTPEELSWSTDGQRFAYTGFVEGDQSDLLLINSDGTNEIRVTDGTEWESSPSWSPLGQLALVRTDCGQFECRAHVALYEDGRLTLLPQALIENTLSTQVQGPLVWSPDGRWILHLAYAPIQLAGQPLVATPLTGVPQVVTIEFGINSFDWQRR